MATKTGKRHQARKRLPNGQRIAGYGKTAEEAEADLAQKLADMDILLTPQVDTLHDLAKSVWFPRIEHLKPLSRKKYIGMYVNWIRPALGHLPPEDVTITHVQQLVNRIAEKKSARLAIFVRELVSQILTCAERQRLITQNVARFATAPSKPEKRIRRVDVEEARSLLEHVKHTELSAPVFLALVLGLRRGEVAGLKWSDLDRQTGELHILRQRQAVRPHGVIESSLKTTGSKRVLRLTKPLIEQIDARGDLDSEYICTYRMEPWVPDTITEKWNAKRPQEFSDWTFHDLRHGAAGLLYAMGCNLLEISKVLGHASPMMSLMYTAESEDQRAKAVATMNILCE